MRLAPAAPRPSILLLGLVLACAVACGDPSRSTDPDVQGEGDPRGESTAEASRTARLDPVLVEAFEEDVVEALARHGVPGAAVALVEGDRVVHSASFGVRAIGRDQPVSEETLFRVADLTRAMTSTMIATLVDEDRLEWDVTAARLGLELPDATLDETVELRHLLSMTSGLGSLSGAVGDFSLGESPSVVGLLESARFLPAVAAVGEHVPQPTLFAAAGYEAAGTAAGADPRGDGPRATYHRLMQERVFGPAGMTRTVVGVRLAAIAEDYAAPHGPVLGGGVVTIDPGEGGVTLPADGVASTVGDLGRFLVLHLRGGLAASGQRVASAANLGATREPIAPVAAFEAERWPLFERCDATMGWTTCEAGADGDAGEADRVIGDVGGVDGFSAGMAFLSERGVGVVVLANLDPRFGGLAFVTEARDAFLARVLERPPLDPVEYEDLFLSLRERLAVLAAVARPVDLAVIDPYLGVYERGWSLARVDGGLDRAPGGGVELRHELRSFPLRATDDPGSYVVAEGPRIGLGVRVGFSAEGPTLSLVDLDGTRLERVSKLY